MFVLHTYIPLQCAVPPGEPLILEEDGDPVQGNTVGPYREGAVVALDCVVYGGIEFYHMLFSDSSVLGSRYTTVNNSSSLV
jgi:hypothetical protein